MNSSASARSREHPDDSDCASAAGLPAHAALSSVALLQGHSSIAIDHLGTRYVLRATRAGKLILTK